MILIKFGTMKGSKETRYIHIWNLNFASRQIYANDPMIVS